METQISSSINIQGSSKRGVQTVIRGGWYEFSLSFLLKLAMLSRPTKENLRVVKIVYTLA
jgi:hypothetical protein